MVGVMRERVLPEIFSLSISVLHISVKIHHTVHSASVHVTVLTGYLIKIIQSSSWFLFFLSFFFLFLSFFLSLFLFLSFFFFFLSSFLSFFLYSLEAVEVPGPENESELAAAILCHSHGNTRSKPCPQPMLQFGTMPNP